MARARSRSTARTAPDQVAGPPDRKSYGKNPFNVVKGTVADDYVLPWALTTIFIPAFSLLWYSLLDPLFGLSRVSVAVVTVLSGVLLTVLTFRESRARSTFVKMRATITVGWLFLSFAVFQLLGPQRAWLGIVFGIGSVLAIAWDIGGAESVRGRGDDGHGRDELAEALGIGGTRGKVASDDGTTRTVNVTHPNVTHKEMSAALPYIAARGHFLPSGVRYLPGKNGGMGKFIIIRRDTLSKSVDWPGPSKPGGSIADPMVVGTRMNGSALVVCRYGPGGAVHTLRAGTPGAGKTNGIIVEIAEAVTRTDVVYWYSDIIKPDGTLPWIRTGVDWFARTYEETSAMVGAIDRIIPERMTWLSERGFYEWVPGCGLPFLVVVFEEAARIVEKLSTRYVRILEAARSAGISICTSMQRPSGSNLDTDARAMMGAGQMFGCKYPEDVSFVLSDTLQDAGADPTQWAANFPGKCYYEFGEPEDQASPGRTFKMDRNILLTHIRTWAPRMTALDTVSALAAGKPYALREVSDIGPSSKHPVEPVPTVIGSTVPPQDGVSEVPVSVPGTCTPAVSGASARVPDLDSAVSGEVVDLDDLVSDLDDAVTGTPDPDVSDHDPGHAEDKEEMKDMARNMFMPEDPEIQELEEAAYQELERGEITPAPEQGSLADVVFGDPFTSGPPLDRQGRDDLFRRIMSDILSEHPKGQRVRKADIVNRWFDTEGTAPPPDPAAYSALDRRLSAAEDDGLVTRPAFGFWFIHPGADRAGLTKSERMAGD
jgi:hypothetical protein